MKKEILTILRKGKFSNPFLLYLEKNFPGNYSVKIKQAFHSAEGERKLLQLKSQERLMEVLAQLIDLKEAYQAKGIPLSHFYKSLYDLHYRIERFYKNEGHYGLTDRDLKWLGPLFRREIFDLGSLRFQISSFSYDEIERQSYQFMPLSKKWKETFPEGTPIITIHILKNADLRPNKIEASFSLARHFFAEYFPEHNYEVFVCRTWLLYGPMREILPSNSNIAHFAKNFQIIAENQNTKQALDRIYGSSNLKVIKQMEKESSLEKTAYQHPEKLGVAAGIIFK